MLPIRARRSLRLTERVDVRACANASSVKRAASLVAECFCIQRRRDAGEIVDDPIAQEIPREVASRQRPAVKLPERNLAALGTRSTAVQDGAAGAHVLGDGLARTAILAVVAEFAPARDGSLARGRCSSRIKAVLLRRSTVIAVPVGCNITVDGMGRAAVHARVIDLVAERPRSLDFVKRLCDELRAIKREAHCWRHRNVDVVLSDRVRLW